MRAVKAFVNMVVNERVWGLGGEGGVRSGGVVDVVCGEPTRAACGAHPRFMRARAVGAGTGEAHWVSGGRRRLTWLERGYEDDVWWWFSLHKLGQRQVGMSSIQAYAYANGG